jgi:O-antigen/teichoic acid export membrane protein
LKQFSKNVLSIISSDIARRLLGFFAVALLARRVGTAGFGAVNIGFTVLSYALIVSTAGLATFGIREVARGVGSEIVNRIISLRTVIAFIAFVVVTAIIQLTVENRTTANLITIFCLSVFANAVLLEWYFQGKERMGIVGASKVVSAIVYLLCIVLFVHSVKNILWVAIGAVIGDLLATFFLLRIYIHLSDTRLRFDFGSWRTLMSQSLPLGIGSIMAHVSVNLAPLVIGIIMTNADVGVYSAASKLIFFLLMFDRLFANLLLPAASRFQHVTPDRLPIILNSAAKFIIIAALPMSVGGTFLSKRIITSVFGAQYVEAAAVFQILIWYFFVTTLHTIFTSGLVAIGHEKLYGKVMVVSTLVYFVFVVVFTFAFGIVGAAIAVVAAEIFTLVLMWYQFQKYVKIIFAKYFFTSLPAVIVMGLALYLLPPLHVSVLVLIGALVYFITLFITRAMTMSDVRELLERV